MSTHEHEQAPNGMIVAFELFDLAIDIRRERHRREHPEASNEEIEAVVRAWISDRPGAPYGDAEGRPFRWPRR